MRRRLELRAIGVLAFSLFLLLACTGALSAGDVVHSIAGFSIPDALSVFIMALAPGGAWWSLAKGISAMKDAKSSQQGSGASDVLRFMQGENAQKVAHLLDTLTKSIEDSNVQITAVNHEILEQLQHLHQWTQDHERNDTAQFDRIGKAIARVEERVINRDANGKGTTS